MRHLLLLLLLQESYVFFLISYYQNHTAVWKKRREEKHYGKNVKNNRIVKGEKEMGQPKAVIQVYFY